MASEALVYVEGMGKRHKNNRQIGTIATYRLVPAPTSDSSSVPRDSRETSLQPFLKIFNLVRAIVFYSLAVFGNFGAVLQGCAFNKDSEIGQAKNNGRY